MALNALTRDKPAQSIAKKKLDEKITAAKRKDTSLTKSQRTAGSHKAPSSKRLRKTSDKDRVKELEAALAKANQEIQERDKQLADKENQPGGALPQHIPKPKGSAGDGFSLIDAMGLEDDTDLYAAILRAVRETAAGIGLDWRIDFRNQDPLLLGRAYKLGRAKFPLLSKYVNDWPQAEIIRQWFANRRRHAVREGYLPKRKERLKEAARAGRVALVNGRTRKKRRQQPSDGVEGRDGESSADEEQETGGQQGDEDKEEAEEGDEE